MQILKLRLGRCDRHIAAVIDKGVDGHSIGAVFFKSGFEFQPFGNLRFGYHHATFNLSVLRLKFSQLSIL